MLSHLYLNQLSLSKKENLIAMLKLYIFTDSQARAKVLANTKRVEAIRDLKMETVNRLHRGILVRGSSLRLQLDPDGFPSRGDMYLFGAMVNRLLSAYSSINSFTQLRVDNLHDKESFLWPAQIGSRSLV